MTTINQKYGALVEKLTARTNSKQIEWRYDSPTATCRAVIGSKSVEIQMARNEIEEPIAVVRIINASGDVVDLFTDETLSGISPSNAVFDSYWRLMSELYSGAKNQALGVGKDVDELLEELDDLAF